MRYIYYMLYYCFAFYLPANDRWKVMGRISNVIRKSICRNLFASTNGNFSIGRCVDFCYLGHQITMGENANLGNYLKIKGNGGVYLGNHVSMGEDITIITQNHRYLESEGYDGFTKGKVIIGDHAWIGDRVIILQGVTIGPHSIIGAGAVVTNDIPSHAIAAGNPARIIKMRKND